MPSASARVGPMGGKQDNLLKGSDLPNKVQKLNVVCVDVRESPKSFNSPFIMSIEKQFEKTEWAINKSNTQALIMLIDDDYEKWIGWEIELSKFLTNNPSTKNQAWGLMVTGAKKLKRKLNLEPPSKVTVRE